MKKILVLMMAALFAAASLSACNDNTDAELSEGTEVSEEAVEETLPEGWTYFPDKMIGYWETQDPMYGIYWGYRFNEDGTLDYVEDRMYNPVGIYECRQDGVHYSDDNGATWDDLVMIIKSQSDTQMVIEFDGVETVLTKYEGEITEYMPAGWTYVEGTDDEIGASDSEVNE